MTDGDEGSGSGVPVEANQPKPSKLKGTLIAAGAVAVLVTGVVIGRMGAGSRSPSAPGTEPRAEGATSPGKKGSIFSFGRAMSPCVRIYSDGTQDADSADYAAELKGVAPDWDISTTLQPSDCEPNMNVKIMTGPFQMSRFQRSLGSRDTIYETNGYAGALAIGAPRLGEGPILAASVGGKRDSVMEDLVKATVKYVREGGTNRDRSAPKIKRDGVTCAKIVGEDDFDHRWTVRNVFRSYRYWTFFGDENGGDCEPDIFFALKEVPIDRGDSIEGYFVAVASMSDSAVPDLAAASGDSVGQARSIASRHLMDGVPAQIDPTASDGSISGRVDAPSVGSVGVSKQDETSRQAKAAGELLEGGPQPIHGEKLQAMLPRSVGSYTLGDRENSGNSAGGVSTTHTVGEYHKGEQSFNLTLADRGGAAAQADAVDREGNRKSSTGYEKVGKVGGRMTTEAWDNTSNRGTYSVLVGNRFIVRAEGRGASMGDLKAAVMAVDFRTLERVAK